MINYSRRLGENMFEKMFPMAPGRIDPKTGMLVTTVQVPLPEFGRQVSDQWKRSAGGGGGYDRGEERPWGGAGGGSRSEEGMFPRARGAYEGMRRAGMAGPGEETGLLQNPALWLILGTGVLIALEANGVTHLSKQA